jgi:DNA ligase (NAD+)
MSFSFKLVLLCGGGGGCGGGGFVRAWSRPQINIRRRVCPSTRQGQGQGRFPQKDPYPAFSFLVQRRLHTHTRAFSTTTTTSGIDQDQEVSSTFVGTSSVSTSTSNDDDTADINHNNDKVYQELKSLSTEIRRHDELYYNTPQAAQQPDILLLLLSDDDYDALVRREDDICTTYPSLLKTWQDESGWGLAATRNGRVGVGPTDAASAAAPRLKRTHLTPMLSLDNVHTPDQLWAWLRRIPKAMEEIGDDDVNDNENEPMTVTIVTEPKLDGVSLSLRYERSKDTTAATTSTTTTTHSYSLVWASTRGDGRRGQDVTAAVAQMTNIPSSIIVINDDDDDDDLSKKKKKKQLISNHDSLEIRGEVVLPNSSFGQLHELAPNVTFSNARNAASGILLRKEKVDIEEADDQAEMEHLRSLLQFYAYDVVVSDKTFLDGTTLRDQLCKWKFSVPLPIATTELRLSRHNDATPTSTATTATTWMENDWTDETIAPMLSYYAALSDHRTTGKSSFPDNTIYPWGDFDMDGCVHKLSQSAMKQSLGRSMKSPKWAVAHKFPPSSAVSKLLDVQVQVGRTGALTPVAILHPVEVGGVTIQRATLHNFIHLQQILGGDHQIPKETPVLVRRAGDVIPQVVQRIHIDAGNTTIESNHQEDGSVSFISLKAPTECPACGSPVVWEEPAGSSSSNTNTNNTFGQIVRCGGPPLSCPPRAITSLAHAYARDALDVHGLSEAKIQQLMDAKLLRFPCDPFQFGQDEWKTVEELPGWGTKSCQNLQASTLRVQNKGISLGRFIYSLGARHVGKHSSELVASCYGNVEAFLQALESAADWKEEEEPSEEDPSEAEKASDASVAVPLEHPFSSLEGKLGIGPVLIQSLLSFSKKEELVTAARDLAKAVRVLEEAPVRIEENSDATNNQRPWQGFRVVFTGSMSNLTRAEAHAAAKQLGAKATPGSVSKSTDMVVYGDKGGKKLDQAIAFGIPTMSADEFSALVEDISNKED